MHDRAITLALPGIFHAPRQWRLVGTGFAADVSPIAHARHARWMADHAHRHAHQEILFVLEGEGMHGLDGRIYPLAPGTVLVFDSFETHDCFLPEWATDCDHLWIMPIHDQFFIHRLHCRNGVCAYQEEWELLLSQEDTGLAPRRCLTGIGADSVLPAEFRRLRVQATVEGLIAAVVHALLSEASTENRTSFQERVIATTCRHIQTTAGKGINLDQLARISGYSKFHFLRLFQRFTGCSVHQYIDRCRLQRVEELEANGGSKTEIAETLGFSCQPAFSRWYRRWKQ